MKDAAQFLTRFKTYGRASSTYSGRPLNGAATASSSSNPLLPQPSLFRHLTALDVSAEEIDTAQLRRSTTITPALRSLSVRIAARAAEEEEDHRAASSATSTNASTAEASSASAVAELRPSDCIFPSSLEQLKIQFFLSEQPKFCERLLSLLPRTLSKLRTLTLMQCPLATSLHALTALTWFGCIIVRLSSCRRRQAGRQMSNRFSRCRIW